MAASASSSVEPIAIVGIGCRFPGGVRGPRDLARFLRAKGDAVRPVPPERWSRERFYHPNPAVPGKTYVEYGGFLHDDVFAFDPSAFGISPREAERIDPQQRLLLEVTWEALEDAGTPIDAVRGSNTGVFIGGFTLDAQTLATGAENLELVDAHVATGTSMTVLSSRLAYTLDLLGPCLTVDTACSSSLVATHLACQAIRDGSCEQALVGGANVMLSPTSTLLMCKGRFLAPDGRSKAFDAGADGYGRGEGAAVVLLKPLKQALADRDRIYAVILGTGTNQDGKTDGMPMPNGESQRRLCRQVVDAAGIDPRRVGYVEAHGTGTRAGDPIEAEALGRIYGRADGRTSDELLHIGSIKTNIGHLEAAAGVAGLIKAALCLRLREVLPQRSFTRLNPDIPFDALNLSVCVDPRPWPAYAKYAAVNSFGYGGTNAHVVLGEPFSYVTNQEGGRWNHEDRSFTLVPISAPVQGALGPFASKLADELETRTDLSLDDLSYTLGRRRAHHGERAAILAESPAGVLESLRALASAASAPRLITGSIPQDGEPKTLWVYTGMGAQWWKMGRELMAHEPVFRKAAEDVDTYFCRHAGWSILDEMLRDERDSRMARNEVAQPANFVLQVALTELLRAKGLRADGFLGHSVGEVASMWASGCLSLEDATFLSYHRSRLQQRVAGQGTMLAAALDSRAAAELIGDELDVTIAAYNAPSSVALAGNADDLKVLAAKLEARGVFHRFMFVEVAYHSPHMTSLEAPLKEALRALKPGAPNHPLYSTTYGRRILDEELGAEYWWRNVRDPVLLHAALVEAIADGYRNFLEVGPHPVLGPAIREVLADRRSLGKSFFTLRRHAPERESVAAAIAALFVEGAHVDWARLAPPGRLVDLPTYPFQRERYWKESSASMSMRLGRPEAHPLLQERADGGAEGFATNLPSVSLEFLRDHRVLDAAVFPGAGYLEMALAAAAELQGTEQAIELKDIAFLSMLEMAQHDVTRLAIQFAPDGQFAIESRTGASEWIRHAGGRFVRGARFHGPLHETMGALLAELHGAPPADALYDTLQERGLDYGPHFRTLRRVRSRDGEVWAEIHSEAEVDSRFVAHPALVDAAFQSLLALVLTEADGGAYVPVRARRVRSYGRLPRAVYARGKGRMDGSDLVADVTLMDGEGRILLQISDLRCRPVTPRSGLSNEETRWIHTERWVSMEAAEPSETDLNVRVVGDAAALQRFPWLSSFEGRDDGHLLFVASVEEEDPVGAADAERLLDVLCGHVEGDTPVTTLTVLTQGAHVAEDGEACRPAHTALWGLARVLMTEHPELQCRLIDMPFDGVCSAELARAAIQATDGEEECLLRSGGRLCRRLVRPGLANEDRPLRQRAVPVKGGESFALSVARPGRLDSLCFRLHPRTDPKPHEVEIEIDYASLNFKDVMKAMGMLSATALEATHLGHALGAEAAGRVTRVGSRVSTLRPGDAVHAFCSGTLGSHVCVDARFVVKKSTRSSMADAACYLVFFTAWHTLCDVARLQKGERVLIHSAAGGVGQAALQIARLVGAEVFATSGTDAKRNTLRKEGVPRVYDSRTLDFADAVLRDTHGEGVDVVLNSLAGAALHASFELVRPGGRFVEIGKQDIAAGAALNMLAFNKSTTFASVDLDRLATARPDFYLPLAQSVVDAFDRGELRALDQEIFPASDIIPAFRRFASGEVAGKVVVDLHQGEVSLAPQRSPDTLFRADRTYLVTGGLGGFGLRTAGLLLDGGAKHVVLASRRGTPAPEEAGFVEALRRRGATVECRALDVLNDSEVRSLVQEIHRGSAPLGGVFHAAAVLDDDPLAELLKDDFLRVVGPKAHGAKNLHDATIGVPLDYFVVYSSISAWVGNPRQGSYCFANAYLDGLISMRRAQGLPGTSVHWGALGDVGMVARDPSTEAHLKGLGVSAMPADRALNTFLQVLPEDPPSLGVMDIDWSKWRSAFPDVSWRRLDEVSDAASAHSRGPLEALRARVAGQGPDEAKLALLERLGAVVAGVLKIPSDEIVYARPVKEYGLDSLMAVEVQSAIKDAIGLVISSMELLSGKSLESLAEKHLGALVSVSDSHPGAFLGASRRPRVDSPEAFAAHCLARICVQPPYFALQDMARDGAILRGRAVPAHSVRHELGAVSTSEAARHLAILGSCAVSFENPEPGKFYYPIKAAEMRVAERAVRLEPLENLELSAKAIAWNPSKSEARAEAWIPGPDGEALYRLDVTYHVIPEESFRSLFATWARPTFEATSGDPYGAWPKTPCGTFTNGCIEADLGVVLPKECVGHFVGFPALPVSIMQRHATNLVVEGERQRTGEADVSVAVMGGNVSTRAFVFAGQHARLRAHSIVPRQCREVWRCEILADGDIAAVFEMEARVSRRAHTA